MKKKGLVLVVIFTLSIILTACNSAGVKLKRDDNIYGKTRYTSEILGTVDRNIPVATNGGLSSYPSYSNIIKDSALKTAVEKENKEIYDFDKMDIDGNLYKGGEPKGGKLIKHTIGDATYNGVIPDSAEAVAKKLYIKPYRKALSLTGLYAPAGEVLTVVLPDSLVRSGGIKVTIGSAVHVSNNTYVQLGYAYNNISVHNSSLNRMPITGKTFALTENVNYIGHPLGGPITISGLGSSDSKPYELTIIGGMETPEYVLGTTTDKEWDRLIKDAPGLYVNVEAGDFRMSMPKFIAMGITGEKIRLVAEFWTKAISLSIQISPHRSGYYGDNGINQMLFDQFIPAGSACAFVNQYYSVAPVSWARGALDYDALMKNGSWGVLHELNHHHADFGAEDGWLLVSEVVNNAITAATYIKYTNIAAGRTERGGLSGWNWVTDYAAAINNVKNLSGKFNPGLSMHVTLMHAFGIDVYSSVTPYTTAAYAAKEGLTVQENFYMQYSLRSEVDLTYYFETLCGFPLGDAVKQKVKSKNYKQFIPLATVYQAEHDGVSTGREFTIPLGQDFNFNFNSNTAVENAGFTTSPANFEIVSVTSPKHGEIYESAVKGIYTYTPDKGEIYDEFEVTFRFLDTPFEVADTTVKIKIKQDSQGLQVEKWDGMSSGDIDKSITLATHEKASSEYIIKSSYVDNSAQNSLMKVTGKLAAPFTGEYTFSIRADDKAVLKMGANLNELVEVGRLNEYRGDYDYTDEKSKYTIFLNEGDVLYFELWSLNVKGRGGAALGWIDPTPINIDDVPDIDEGEGQRYSYKPMVEEVPVIVDVPNTFMFHIDGDVTKLGSYKTDYNVDIKMKEKQNIEIKSTITALASPAEHGSGSINNMTDEDVNSLFHSKVGIISPSDPTVDTVPLEFIFELGHKEIFNTVDLKSREKGKRGRIRHYALYVGEDLSSMKEVSAGVAIDNQFATIKFKPLLGKYIKLLAYSVYGNEPYIAFSDMTVGTSFESTSFISHQGTDLEYTGDWEQETKGHYLNGGIMTTGDGKIKFAFSGTGFALYSKVSFEYGVGKIRIDDGEWMTFDQYSEDTEYGKMVFAIENLEDKIHTVEIVNEEDNVINIDYIGFIPTVPVPDEPMAVIWIVLIAIAAFAVSAGIGVGAYFLTGFLKKKNKPKNKSNKNKDKIDDNYDNDVAEDYSKKSYDSPNKNAATVKTSKVITDEAVTKAAKPRTVAPKVIDKVVPKAVKSTTEKSNVEKTTTAKPRTVAPKVVDKVVPKAVKPTTEKSNVEKTTTVKPRTVAPKVGDKVVPKAVKSTTEKSNVEKTTTVKPRTTKPKVGDKVVPKVTKPKVGDKVIPKATKPKATTGEVKNTSKK